MSPLDLKGRHSADRPRPPQGFICPSCAAENSGPLEQGCTACGAGTPGTHIGVQPAAIRPDMLDLASAAAELLAPPHTPPPIPSTNVGDAFLEWIKPHRATFDPAILKSLYDAFLAGYQLGVGTIVQPDLHLTGTAETRTIIAALKLFIENVLPTAAEEISHGEFLTVTETERLIQKLERTQ